MATHNAIGEMKGQPYSEPGQHFETAKTGGFSDTPSDPEKTAAVDSGEYDLSRIATQDRDPVVTAKTWAVVVVRVAAGALSYHSLTRL